MVTTKKPLQGKEKATLKTSAKPGKPTPNKTEIDQEESEIDSLYWVGIGASAGGLEALREMIKKLPKRSSNITYLITQHLSPKHQSMMVQLLARETTMPVKEVIDGIKPQPGIIYITPPNSDLFIKKGFLHLRKPLSEHSPKPSVDLFFSTLAEELGDRAIGVILSGTGSDGSHGVRAIRAGGGLTIAQVPETAKYDGMPNNAIETNCVDIVLPPEKIGTEIASLIRSPRNLHLLQDAEEKRTAMQELLHLLKRKTGVDFKDYKTGTLLRRLNRRITTCGVEDLTEYLEYIQKNPKELELLFQDIMITVTQFFRDKEVFENLKDFIAGIFTKKEDGANIRAWIPGCATGEEAYSILILFAEAAGGVSKLQQNYNFQLFATDIDVEALALARKGVYPEITLEKVDPAIRKKYFRHKENSYEIVKSIRDLVVFSKHNVFDDPPFLRLDLISCRNLLIYFNSKLQSKVLNLFHYALNPSGILLLGKSEALGQSSHLFQSIDNKAKLFKCKLVTPSDSTRSAKLSYTTMPKLEIAASATTTKVTHDLTDAVIDSLSPDSLLIDENMDILRIYGDVQAYTQLSPGDVSTNLTSLARKEFRQELRALVYKVLREAPEETILPKKLNINGKMHKVNIIIRPLSLKNSLERLILISFEKVQKIEKKEDDSKRFGTDPIVTELEQELAMTREHLQTVVEELETSNEELQSTNEEMQSTNEELQSSNEELETANEELQSTNEELLTVNEELQFKSAELSIINEDLDNIKESIDIPILVVNKDLTITRFNQAASKIFLLGDNAEGKALTSVATIADIPELGRNVIEVITTGEPFTRQLDDSKISLFERILPYKDGCGNVKGAVLTYIDNTKEQGILHQLKESQERYDLAVQGSNAGIWDWNIKTGEMHWSKLFLYMLGLRNKDFSPSIEDFKQRIHDVDREDVLAILNAHLNRGFDFNVEFRMRKYDNNYIWLHARGQAVWDSNREAIRMVGSVYDITERRKALEHLNKTNESLERFAYICSHDLKEPARLIENFVGLFHRNYWDVLDDKAKEYLHFIEESAGRMQKMIKGILAYSQIENKNLNFDEVNLEEELERVLENLKLSIDETNASITYDPLPTSIRADKIQISQLFQNLIGNAIKFCKKKRPLIHISADGAENEWLFSIKDNGIGMKLEDQDKIFKMFRCLNKKDKYPGNGIGLTICQQIVKKHGGRIWVESEPGNGSTFHFTLPKRKNESRLL